MIAKRGLGKFRLSIKGQRAFKEGFKTFFKCDFEIEKN